MTGEELKQARLKNNWTQQYAASKLGVSQGYVSLLERNQRAFSMRLVKRLLNVFDMPPTALPVRYSEKKRVDMDELTNSLGALGYPGFSYVRAHKPQNPADVLLCALKEPDLDSRVAEGLPWLMYTYSDMDRDWLTKNAKLSDLQNRLGFVVTLARKFAQRNENQTKSAHLSEFEVMLERSRLAREDTFCHESLTDVEKRWLRGKRPPEAKHWNLLSDLTLDHLSHATP